MHPLRVLLAFSPFSIFSITTEVSKFLESADTFSKSHCLLCTALSSLVNSWAPGHSHLMISKPLLTKAQVPVSCCKMTPQIYRWIMVDLHFSIYSSIFFHILGYSYTPMAMVIPYKAPKTWPYNHGHKGVISPGPADRVSTGLVGGLAVPQLLLRGIVW